MELFAMESVGNSELCSSWCRLCLKVDVVNLNIFSETGIEKQIAMKLNTCFPLNISENDDKRTHNICFICCLTLEATYKLRQKAINSDKFLRNIFQHNQNKLQVASSSTNIGPPVQKKMRVQCSTNLSKPGVVPVFNMPQSQVMIPISEKENEPLHFTDQLPVDNMENLQPSKKQHRQMSKKLMKTPTNKQVDLQSQDLINANIKSNDNFSAQTPRSIKPQVVESFPNLTHSPKPVRTAMQRKRHRENLARSTDACTSDALTNTAACSSQKNCTTVPITPKRNELSQKPPIEDLTNTAEKYKVLQKRSHAFLADNGNTPLNKSLVLSRTRSPLAEKVISLENRSEINLQTPKAIPRDKRLTKDDARNTLSAKCTNIMSADKKRESGSSTRHFLEISTDQKCRNILEPCNEKTVNSVTKRSRGAVEKCITENCADARGKTPSKSGLAEEDLIKKAKNYQNKKKTLDEDLANLANKASRNLYEFTDSPDMEIAQKYTSVKQIAKRPTIFDTSEVCFETRPVQIYEKIDLGTSKKPQQGNSSSVNHGTPSPSNNEGSESSFGTFAKDVPSSQSEEHITPMRSMTKLLPDDVRDSWKKASGTWDSQSINIESEDPFNYGELGACMATGDIFGAGIARKMTNRMAVDDKLNDSSKLNMHNVSKRRITKGTSSALSSLSSPSSAPSSLNLSSGDDSVQKYNPKSTLLKENQTPVPKTPGNLKQFETWQAKTKSPTKPLNLQAHVGSAESAVSAEGSSQTDSSDFHLTPEFVRLAKK